MNKGEAQASVVRPGVLSWPRRLLLTAATAFAAGQFAPAASAEARDPEGESPNARTVRAYMTTVRDDLGAIDRHLAPDVLAVAAPSQEIVP